MIGEEVNMELQGKTAIVTEQGEESARASLSPWPVREQTLL